MKLVKIRKVWHRNPRTQVVGSRKRYVRAKLKRETRKIKETMERFSE